jgi:hypothetical protein
MKIFNPVKHLICLFLVSVQQLQGAWLAPSDPFFTPAEGVPLPNSYDVSTCPVGNAIAVWSAYDGLTSYVRAIRYDYQANTWGSTATLSPTAPGANSSVSVELDGSGNGVAIWLAEDTNGNTQILSIPYNGTTITWGAQAVVTSSSFVSDPQLSVMDDGNAVAVWKFSSGKSTEIRASNYDVNTNTWSNFTTISSVSGIDVFVPQVGVDASGNAVAVWECQDGTTLVIQAAYYTAGFWGAPVTISASVLDQPATNPQVSVNDLGNAIAIWEYTTNVGTNIQSAFFTPNTWSAPVDLFVPVLDEPAAVPQIDLDPSGDAIAVWRRFDGVGKFYIQASRYASSTWSLIPTDLTPPTVEFDANYPRVCVDSIGNALAVWQRNFDEGTALESIVFNENTNSWQEITKIITDSNPVFPKLSMDDSGISTAIWAFDDGISPTNVQGSVNQSIHSKIVASPSSVPASGVAVSTITDQLLDQFGLPIVGDNVQLAQDGSSVISAPSGPSNANGIVTFTVTNVNKEKVTYTATNTSTSEVVGAVQVDFVSAVDVNKSTVIANPTSVAADGKALSTITVTVLNTDNLPVEGATVVLNANQGHSIISPVSGVSNEEGVVLFTVKDSVPETIIYSATVSTDEVTANLTEEVTIVQTAEVSFIRPEAPLVFSGKVVKNKFLNATELTNVLEWSRSLDPSVVGYRLYQNGVLILETADLSAILHERVKGKVYTYALASVNSAGVESIKRILSLP